MASQRENRAAAGTTAQKSLPHSIAGLAASGAFVSREPLGSSWGSPSTGLPALSATAAPERAEEERTSSRALAEAYRRLLCPSPLLTVALAEASSDMSTGALASSRLQTASAPVQQPLAQQKHLKRLESPMAFSLDLLAGGAVACVAHTIVAPIERIKLVLQTQDSNVAILSGKHRHYKGFFDALGTIVKEEGFWSLWRGNLTSVVRYIPSVSLNFAFKDYYRLLLAPTYSEGKPSPLRLASGNLAAGAAAGATSLFFTYPLDIAHTRLATDIGVKKQFSSLPHFLRQMYRKEGIRGLYHGFPASVHGIIIHRSIYFGGFDSAKQLLLSDGPEPSQDGRGPGGEGRRVSSHRGSFWKRWLLAQGATTSASLLSYPFDTVRHRMMMQSGREQPEYRSTWDCWKTIFRKEGVRGFYKGLMSNILRGTGAAFVLVMYDELQGQLHKALTV